MGLGVTRTLVVVDGGITTASCALDNIAIKLAMEALGLVIVAGIHHAFVGPALSSFALVIVLALMEPIILVRLLDILSWFLFAAPFLSLMHFQRAFEKFSKMRKYFVKHKFQTKGGSAFRHEECWCNIPVGLGNLSMGGNAFRHEECWCNMPVGNEIHVSWLHRKFYAGLYRWNNHQIIVKKWSLKPPSMVLWKDEEIWIKNESIKICLWCPCMWLSRFRGTQKRNWNKPEQDEGYIQYRVPVEQETSAISYWEDKFLEEVHFEPKWKDKSVFTFSTIEERRWIQMGTRAWKSFSWDQDVHV